MILVIGCGFLGSCIVDHLAKKTDGEKIIATVRNIENAPQIDNAEFVQCDLTDLDSIKRLKEKCSDEKYRIVYLSAVHNIDFVAENPEIARKTNIDALGNFINLFDDATRFIFTSTDCVYGDKAEYRFNEKDSLNPVNEYGRQKAEAEKIVLTNNYNVVRMPLMFGSSPSPKKGFYDNCKEKLFNNQSVSMLDGYFRSTLSFKDAAEFINILLLSKKAIPPVVNVCSDEIISKYEIGCRLANKWGKPKELIEYIPEENGEKFYREKRANCTLMNNSVLKNILGIKEIKFNLI